jgi:glycosylphosphatidylinositol transamidase (GPIT) subunit GPI8
MNKKNIAKELKLLDLEQIALKKLENSSRWGVGSDHPLGPKNLKKINEDDLNSTLDSDNSQNNSPKNNLKNSKNISNDMYDMDDDNTVLTANSSVGHINSLKSKTAPLKSAYANANTTRSKSLKPLSNALFYDTNQSTISDFQPGLVKTTKSRAEDPSMTLLVVCIICVVIFLYLCLIGCSLRFTCRG